ncbi:hypothetical protein BU17DRAFT_70913 [Hysterangium stoloniferum]|nr:hypothetical protein BU17DRAFT_70913 [Hysterangium stoloniferum]
MPVVVQLYLHWYSPAVVEVYLHLHVYAEKVAKLLVELQLEHAWQLLQQSQVGVAHHDLQVQVYVDSVEAAMVAEVHTGVQEDFYHGRLERSFANAAYTPHLAPAGDGIQVFEEDP